MRLANTKGKLKTEQPRHAEAKVGYKCKLSSKQNHKPTQGP